MSTQESGRSYAQERSVVRAREKARFDVVRPSYLASYQSFETDNQPLARARDNHTRVQAHLHLASEQATQSQLPLAAQVAAVERDMAFVKSQLADLAATQQEEARTLKGKLNTKFRQGPLRRVAQWVFYPDEFMEKQLKRVEGVRMVYAEQQREVGEETEATLGALREEARVAEAGVYEIEREWALAGDVDRVVMYAADHPGHREDLLTRYLEMHPQVDGRRQLDELYRRYAQFIDWIEPVKREQPPVSPPPAKARVISPKSKPGVEMAIEVASDTEGESIEEEHRFLMLTGPKADPVLVTNAQEIEDLLPARHGYVTGQDVYDELVAFERYFQEHPDNLRGRYSEMVETDQGGIRKWRKVSIGNQWRVIIAHNEEGMIVFRFGDHQEVLGIKRKIRRRKN